MKMGLFYYSKTGNTKKIASIIDERIRGHKINIDMIEIQPRKHPNFITGRYKALMKKELPVTNENFDMNPYDIVLVGSPVWAGKPAPFIKTFLNNATHLEGKKMAFFFTYKGDPPKEDSIKPMFEALAEEKKCHIVKKILALQMKKGDILKGEKKINGFIVDLFTK